MKWNNVSDKLPDIKLNENGNGFTEDLIGYDGSRFYVGSFNVLDYGDPWFSVDVENERLFEVVEVTHWAELEPPIDFSDENN